eukprot:m.176770 g.176770  ORF g.176770 m.176770 type:complete len:382 (+) comp14232_c0_seq1:151-1296(+)
MTEGRPDYDSPLDPKKLKESLLPERTDVMQHEYNGIPSYMPQMSDLPPGTKQKNRYVNVLPNASTRVPLSKVDGDETSDFINANFVSGYNWPKRFIATQGPMPKTMGDFWRMIWEQNVSCIVMTTGLQEGGRKKCDRYWPVEGTEEYSGGFTVTVTDSADCGTWILTTMTVSKGDAPARTLKHFWYTGWPDHGVPETAAPVIAFLRAVRAETSGSRAPILVHCSAGIGRTGTFMAIDSGMQQLQSEWRVCDIKGTVTKMRKERGGSVQTAVQYRFIHLALAEYCTPSLAHSMFGSNEPRDVTLTKSDEFKYFGFTARGSHPVFLNMVDPGGLADTLGVKEGDHVLAVNGVDTMRLSHKQVIELIIKAGDSVTLSLLSKVPY